MGAEARCELVRETRRLHDNGPVFAAIIAQKWSEMNKLEFQYLQPPTQNAYIERFNKTYRESVLDAYLFDNLDEVREVSQKFVDDYNNHRPHDALGGISPRKYRELMTEGTNPFEGLRFASATPSLHCTYQRDCLTRKELSTFEVY